jgi:Holliday junction resolvasome RuvABC endonuclease subunit
MPVVLCLDPGKATGFGKLRFFDGRLDLLDCGELPITKAGDDGRLICVWNWMMRNADGVDVVVLEEFVKSHYAPSDKEAHEVRGVIRLCCVQTGVKWESFGPSTISSILSVGTAKKQAERRRLFVNRALGFQIQGRPHVGDALAVGLAYGIQNGLWMANFSIREDRTSAKSSVTKSAKSRTAKRDIACDMTEEQIRDGIRRGTIPVRGAK